MSKAVYWQQGSSLDYINVTDETIVYGTVIELVSRIGVAGCDIPSGETGAIVVEGVFEIPKTDAAQIPMGMSVYFDGNGITSSAEGEKKEGQGMAEPNIPAGYAAELSPAGADLIKVKLLG
ncbi:MAG: DUF2190 family protein [Lachnospiraceae bacterium]|nr:DUF2190 family protein [Lachnospiraceae bacterium]